MWQLCNWTRLDDNAYQRFCLMSLSCLPASLSAQFLIQEKKPLILQLVFLPYLTIYYLRSRPVLQQDIPAFSEGFWYVTYAVFLPLWLTACHSLPLSPRESVVWFVFHTRTLHKRGLSPKALDKDPNLDLQTLKSPQYAACPEEVVVKIAPRACD